MRWTVESTQGVEGGPGAIDHTLEHELHGWSHSCGQDQCHGQIATTRPGPHCQDRCGTDETGFLDPLVEIVESGQTPAERKLALFHGEWQGSVDPVFREFAY